MKVICGLGNPGQKYEKTRHNVGFRAVEALAKRMEASAWSEDGKSLVSSCGLGKEKILFIKPLTFMNLSGEAILESLQFYKVDPKDLIVIFDDVDLPLGSFRFREKGSAGTHNGMRSIVQSLATLDFPRYKIGIESRGVSAPSEMPLDVFVLAPFSREEELQVEKLISELVEVILKGLLGKSKKSLA